MSAPLREALSRALARAPHAALGAHEAHVVEALRGALALVGGPCAVTLKIDPARTWAIRAALGEDVVEALREHLDLGAGAPDLEAALDCAAIVTSDALHATLGAGCEASHAA